MAAIGDAPKEQYGVRQYSLQQRKHAKCAVGFGVGFIGAFSVRLRKRKVALTRKISEKTAQLAERLSHKQWFVVQVHIFSPLKVFFNFALYLFFLYIIKKEVFMVTVLVVLALAAFICAIAAAINKAPLWVAVIVLCLIELLRALPIGK